MVNNSFLALCPIRGDHLVVLVFVNKEEKFRSILGERLIIVVA
jgi:hypothetical protein